MPIGQALALLSVVVFASPAPLEAFTIVVEESCQKEGVYAYHFTDKSALSDFDVRVSETAFEAELTIRLVSAEWEANVKLVDDESQAAPDMRICESASLSSGVAIMVSPTAYNAELTVRLSKVAFEADYKLYVHSTRLSPEEAAALFAVVWEKNRRKKLE